MSINYTKMLFLLESSYGLTWMLIWQCDLDIQLGMGFIAQSKKASFPVKPSSHFLPKSTIIHPFSSCLEPKALSSAVRLPEPPFLCYSIHPPQAMTASYSGKIDETLVSPAPPTNQ